MLIVWFGDLITEKKMGNGISMIIFAGIVATLPMSLFNTLVTGVNSVASIISVSIFLVLSLLMIVGIVYVNEGERRVPVSYARHVRGNKVFGGMNTHLPLKVNQAGVIPIIFAISFLAMPGLFGQLFATSTNAVLVNISQFMINITENV
jgi:preprotein translocase subunit SecY